MTYPDPKDPDARHFMKQTMLQTLDLAAAEIRRSVGFESAIDREQSSGLLRAAEILDDRARNVKETP